MSLLPFLALRQFVICVHFLYEVHGLVLPDVELEECFAIAPHFALPPDFRVRVPQLFLNVGHRGVPSQVERLGRVGVSRVFDIDRHAHAVFTQWGQRIVVCPAALRALGVAALCLPSVSGPVVRSRGGFHPSRIVVWGPSELV